MIFGINLLAVLVAALSSFVIGALWYGPLFGKAWMKACNITEEDLSDYWSMVTIYGLAFALTLVPATYLDFVLGGMGTGPGGAAAGCVSGLVFVAVFTGIQYLFERRPPQLFLINAGYSVLALTTMGAITGAW